MITILPRQPGRRKKLIRLQAARVEFRRDTLGGRNSPGASHPQLSSSNESKDYPTAEGLRVFTVPVGNSPELKTGRRGILWRSNGI
jgi:hypothetical protein